MHRLTNLVVVCSALCAAVGCTGENALTASLDRSYKDPIQTIVEGKLGEQSTERTAKQRWADYKRDEYQGLDELARDGKRLKLELKRQKAAARRLRQGPLTLAECLIYSLEFNDQIQAGRARIRAVGGEKLIANSRFLPHLAFDLTKDAAEDNISKNLSSGLTAVQTLLEFGKDNVLDVALRASQRQALFDYERAAAIVLTDVRRRFYTIVLRDQQLAARRKLLAEFRSRHQKMRRLETNRRVVAVDVLTAELNVLSEEMRINALVKELQRQKLDLLRAIGFPVKGTGFTLAGSLDRFGVPLSDAVKIAYRRSTRVAQARATVFEQDRVVRQVIWDYFPDVDFLFGYRNKYAAAGLGASGRDGLYQADPYAEYRFARPEPNTFRTDPDWEKTPDPGWFWSLDMTLPIFQGLENVGRFRREKALLEGARHLLSDTVIFTELEVRKAYQTVLEHERETDILQQMVTISKERLRVMERLKELGKITDNELETFRSRFFADQDRYFEGQIRLVDVQERLRLVMRHFQPANEVAVTINDSPKQ